MNAKVLLMRACKSAKVCSLSSYAGTSTPASRADTLLAKSAATCTWRIKGNISGYNRAFSNTAKSFSLGKAALESRRQAAQEHRRRRVQACGARPHLPEVHLRRLRGSRCYAKLKAGEGDIAGADPEDKDEYKRRERLLRARRSALVRMLVAKPSSPPSAVHVDAAMDAIEKENPSLKGVLPKVFARKTWTRASLGGLIDLIGNIALGDAKARSADVLGHVFEYFLGEFALAEGKQGGQFYTPRSIVELLVAMLEPYKGRVFDPCCGSGGMFVQSEKFVEEAPGPVNDISIYGQESNQTTWRLAKMNLAIRGIDSSQVKWNNEGSFLNDAHKDLKADFIIANPPFNVSDWSGELLRGDGRWQYGTPPVGNANFAWLQHFVHHLAPNGRAGVVLAKGALTSKTSGEGDIRKALVADGNLIDCIVNLPAKLFLNTQIPAACGS
jgi:type I restriction enzyme M protein